MIEKIEKNEKKTEKSGKREKKREKKAIKVEETDLRPCDIEFGIELKNRRANTGKSVFLVFEGVYVEVDCL